MNTLIRQIADTQIKPTCEYTYSSVHDLSFDKDGIAYVATCKHCKGEWVIRDGKATERKAPVSPWLDETQSS